jgi:dienelactone hydrolase
VGAVSGNTPDAQARARVRHRLAWSPAHSVSAFKASEAALLTFFRRLTAPLRDRISVLEQLEATMQTERISYQVDGIDAIGYLAVPDGTDPCAGVLLCHEGPGQDANVRLRAERVATELGHVAFALDYIGGGTPLDTMEETMARLGPLRDDPIATRSIGQAGLDILAGQSRVDTDRLASIGFCFGGTMSLELARSGADVKAVVGFHSGLGTGRPDDAANITGKVLVCIGADDPMIPPDQREAFENEMRSGNVDWRMTLHGGAVHSFTNPDAGKRAMAGVAYNADADRRSWAAMVDLFAETIA